MTPDRQQARRHLDARLIPLSSLTTEPRPHRGWIRAIRDALGMSSTELAKRMGVRQQVVNQFERNEVNGSIKLDTLRRVADNLDCELVYFLIPRQSLTEAVKAQATRKAREYLEPLEHHSRLEDQEPAPADREVQLAELAEQLIDRKGLWA